MKRNLLISVVALALLCGSAPEAMAQASPDMAQVVRQLRETAERMRGQLPPEDIAEMLRNADELERENRKGSFAPVAAPASPPIIAHLEKVHGATFEWLMRTTTCAGYQWENWRRYDITTGDHIAERNAGCKRAFGLYERYFLAARSGDQRTALPLLAEYDKAAHEIVDAYGMN
ncbi:hypothetical protein GCM10022280_08830 [Sphingomonas swuensis]|uniref:Secreted protein n=1 Tax=Sphingomonas swuensis TaxID=977800 RepID=A0ABP7SKJ8_9SPHN